MQTKTCTKCGAVLPLSGFAKKRCRGKFGVRAQCRACCSISDRQYRHPPDDEIRRKDRARWWAHYAEQLERGRRYRRRLTPEQRRRKYHMRAKPKRRAQALLQHAVRSGKLLKPTACERCHRSVPSRRLHGHHADYDRPLDVQWLCTRCHAFVHRKRSG